MTERDDGLGIFADVITGALGIVMFTALFFALRALSSHAGVAGLKVRPELQAELARERLAVAEARRERAETGLAGGAAARVEREERGPTLTAAAEAGDLTDEVEAARRRDYGRQQLRLTELEILAVAADQTKRDYAHRQSAAVEAFCLSVGSALIEPPAKPARPLQPYHVLVKADRAYPLFHFRDGAVRRETEHVGWLLYDQGRRMRAFPQVGQGWSGEEAIERLGTTVAEVASLGWQVSLLVEADGFGFARAVVRELRARGATVSWRPIQTGDYVSLSADALPPL